MCNDRIRIIAGNHLPLGFTNQYNRVTNVHEYPEPTWVFGSLLGLCEGPSEFRVLLLNHHYDL